MITLEGENATLNVTGNNQTIIASNIGFDNNNEIINVTGSLTIRGPFGQPTPIPNINVNNGGFLRLPPELNIHSTMTINNGTLIIDAPIMSLAPIENLILKNATIDLGLNQLNYNGNATTSGTMQLGILMTQERNNQGKLRYLEEV
ncbi:MAG: hypothetical protein RCG15_08475 [Candidatus Rickettsia vulgarisii]